MNAHAYNLAFDIVCIDVDYMRPRLACAYLAKHNGTAAVIDCGTSRSVPNILAALSQLQLKPKDVEYVIPTHVHLDHAGGAGVLMQTFPNATLIVHPKGAQHLIDPGRLIESTTHVYGEKRFKELYGEVVPVDASRVHMAEDGETIDLKGRQFEIAHTPGHARHHFCIFDSFSNGWFTGDTFGLSYPDIICDEQYYLLPTTTPVQFEPDAWQQSIKRLLIKNPQRMYLTHFNAVENVTILAKKLSKDINQYVEIAQQNKSNQSRVEDLQSALLKYTLEDLNKYGCQQSRETLLRLLATDIELNAQGLDIWLTRQEKKAANNR